jgi:uncharacterized membrane protein YdjX (TVP38/TMEM64 family)
LKASSGAFRILIGCGLAAVLVAAMVASRFLGPASVDALESLLEQVRSLGPAGPLGLILIQILVALSGVLPASLIGVVSGAVYGIVAGFGVAAVSTMCGAVIAFLLSRSLLRPLIARLIERRSRLRNFDAMLARDGWRFVFLLRLSPIMPFAVTSYALGLSSIGLRGYLIGCLASLPSLLGYVVIGALTKSGLASLSQGPDPFKWALIGVGIIATGLATWRIGRIAALAGLTRPMPAVSD